MPFVPKSELAALQDENAEMAERLRQYDEMRPFLQLAGELRDELVTRVTDDPTMSPQQIGELAYRKVLETHIDQARDEAAAEYEQQHRRTLYERLLGEIAVAEGASISDKVRNRVETDPELALELRNSARKELAARATNVVRGEISEEQQEVVNREAERQVELDRLDVEFALEGRLDVSAEKLQRWIRPGDKVELLYGDEGRGKRRDRIVLTWTKDSKDKEGWVYTHCSGKLVSDQGYNPKIETNRFVRIASVGYDLEAGKDVRTDDTLVAGQPIVLLQRTNNGSTRTIELKTKTRRPDDYGAYSTSEPVILRAIDFQTRDIEFV
ncbi:MAG TPA: hypothetical protein VLF59_02965 [Candidatus Saccharimonadales bacterium]|nr:hypothetical protein [Candidatus Saccharimonadales bacterium]